MPPLERTARAASNEMAPSFRLSAKPERGTKKSEDHIQSESKSKSSIQKGGPKSYSFSSLQLIFAPWIKQRPSITSRYFYRGMIVKTPSDTLECAPFSSALASPRAKCREKIVVNFYRCNIPKSETQMVFWLWYYDPKIFGIYLLRMYLTRINSSFYTY